MNNDAFENEVAMSLQMLPVTRNMQIYELTKNEKMIHDMWFIIQHHMIVFYLSIDTIKN